jgi:hypothetical protein
MEERNKTKYKYPPINSPSHVFLLKGQYLLCKILKKLVSQGLIIIKGLLPKVASLGGDGTFEIWGLVGLLKKLGAMKYFFLESVDNSHERVVMKGGSLALPILLLSAPGWRCDRSLYADVGVTRTPTIVSHCSH